MSKTCPLYKMGLLANEGVELNYTCQRAKNCSECDGEDCQWWEEKTEDCAIAHLSSMTKHLFDIANEVYQLPKRH